MSATGTRAVAALRRAGVPHEHHAYESVERHGAARNDRPNYGLEAAAALGVDPSRVCKTLVAAADGALTLAIVPTSRTLDLKRLAVAVGAHRAVMAQPADAERATGYLVGGISPIATTRRTRVVLDLLAASLERVYVSACRRGLQVSLRPDDLLAAIGAMVASISAEEADTCGPVRP